MAIAAWNVNHYDKLGFKHPVPI